MSVGGIVGHPVGIKRSVPRETARATERHVQFADGSIVGFGLRVPHPILQKRHADTMCKAMWLARIAYWTEGKPFTFQNRAFRAASGQVEL